MLEKKLYIIPFIVSLWLLSCCPDRSASYKSEPLTGIRKSKLDKHINGFQSSDSSSLDSICIIDIDAISVGDEWECLNFLFRHNGTIAYIDSNMDYGSIYYSLNSIKSSKIFNLYDTPTGRQKILLFNTKNKTVLLSDWYDDAAIGDSVDIKSINLRNNNFKVWTKQGNNNLTTYVVKLQIVNSW